MFPTEKEYLEMFLEDIEWLIRDEEIDYRQHDIELLEEKDLKVKHLLNSTNSIFHKELRERKRYLSKIKSEKKKANRPTKSEKKKANRFRSRKL